ncbi:MAG: hypothetical protein HYY23_00685 [Verrucomicrobia bacterium]|nr:hypothetical protein [Verrucomicrobiota bacterium]
MNTQHLLDALTREGVLINVSVRYWRATRKLSPEDLGLDPDNVTGRLICLGHKKLLPKEALERFALVESRAHGLIESSTFPFLSGLGHFLPNNKLEAVTSKLKELETEFGFAQQAFLDQYAQLRLQASAEWREAAQRLVTDPDRLVAAIEASFPEPTAMQRAFGFETQLFQVRAPERLELALVTQANQEQVIAARQKAAEEASVQIHRGAESFVADCVASLRQQTAELCQEMLDSMRSGKTGVHQRTLNRLVRFIEEFKQLNFVGDQQMESELERVRQEFLSRSAEEYRDQAFARTQLQEGLQALSATARQLAQQDATELVQRFGSQGVRRFNLAA